HYEFKNVDSKATQDLSAYHITKGSEGKIQGGNGIFLFFCIKKQPYDFIEIMRIASISKLILNFTIYDFIIHYYLKRL
ncbi:hypothetical protein, partial [[Ruminococcus] torques]|uniref:hypothetical protein n=1 Tax=[Ruminococcus] torques TaxID=33039 RepID=UPI001D071784